MIAARWLPVILCLALTSLAQQPGKNAPAPAQPAPGQKGSQTSTAPNSPNISDVKGNVNIQYGVTPKQLQELLQAAGKAQQEKLDAVSKQLQTTTENLRGFLTILQGNEVPIEKWPQTLSEIAERYRGMMQRLAVLAPDDPKSKSILEQAQAILSKAHSIADYDRADALLAEVEAADISAIQEAENLEREAQAAARSKRRSAAATRAERGELSMTRLDYPQAALHFKAAADMVEHGEDSLRRDYLNRYVRALYQQGYEKGDNVALGQAISVYRQELETLQRKEFPLDWAMTQNNLGNALHTLGERESGTARLEEALTAYRDALKEYTRERVPLDWAMTQNNLGNVLQTLGERESGTARLEEAVTAFRDALKERTRERVPLQWATTQNNLGNALWTLGERESGTARLEEAVTAFRDALKERTRERVPLEWAMTQNNLGNVLQALGERESGTARLEEAVTAFRDALKERTRERVPLDWAMTQNNLGAGLQMLGARESGTARLEEAITAIQAARSVYSSAGMTQYEDDFKERLDSIQSLIAQRRSK